MKKQYMISRIIIGVMTILIFLIMFINESSEWNLVAFLFGLFAFGISFPSTFISEKIINFGSKIKKPLIKVLYYFLIPILSFIVFYLVYCLITAIFDLIPNTDLGDGLIMLGLVTLFTVIIIIPYVQSLILLLLRKLKIGNN